MKDLLLLVEQCSLSIRTNQSLRARNLITQTRESLLSEKQELEDAIESLVEEQKRLKEDTSSKQKIFSDASRTHEEVVAKKTKMDKPTFATVENILLQYEISPARYHGGKLNGVDCRELMSKAKVIFPEIEAALHSIEHPQRCSSETIEQ